MKRDIFINLLVVVLLFQQSSFFLVLSTHRKKPSSSDSRIFSRRHMQTANYLKNGAKKLKTGQMAG